MTLKTKALSGVRWMTLATSAKFGLQMAQVLLLARWLDRGEMGLFSILLVVIGISQFFSDMGISQALVHFQKLSKKQLNTLYWLNVVAGAVVCLMLTGLAYPIAWFYDSPDLILLIQLGAFVFIIKPFGQQFLFLFQKELRFKKIALSEIAAEGVGLAVIIILLIAGKGIFAVPYGMLANAVIFSLLFFFQGLKIHRPDFQNFDLKSCRECLRFGIFLMGERTLNYISTNLDKIIFGKFFGMEFLGAYELAHQLLIRPLGFLSAIAGRITFPLFSKIQSDLARLNDWYLKNIRLFTFLAFPVYLGLLATTEETVRLLFGPGWELTVAIFHIIGWLGIFVSVGNPVGSYLLALGRTDYGFFGNVYQIIIYALFLLIGVQLFDWQGTLLTYLIGTTLFMMPLDYYFRHRLTRMPIRPHLQIWLKNLLISGAMFVLVIALKKTILPMEFPYLATFCLNVVAGIIVYFALSHWLNRETVRFIFDMIKKPNASEDL